MILSLLTMTFMAHAHDANYFQIECDKYLILNDARFFESESVDDLDMLLKTYKARAYLYGHPLDDVMIKFIDQELKTREVIL